MTASILRKIICELFCNRFIKRFRTGLLLISVSDKSFTGIRRYKVLRVGTYRASQLEEKEYI
jgi:hypothetical protein